MLNQQKKITIYDIAHETGLSASTVSRVVNNKPGVKPETYEKVKSVLQKYSYSPNALARGLVSQSSRTVGLLLSDMRIAHHTTTAYVIERELSKFGYCCILFNTGSDQQDRVSCIQAMSSRMVDAVILIGSTFQQESVSAAIDKYLGNIPVIIENGELPGENTYSILIDEELGVADCVRYLISGGRRRLAFINGEDTPSNRLKQRGFTAAVAAEGAAALSRVLTADGPDDWSAGYAATRRLFDASPDTDGVIYATDLHAAGGLRALQDMGLAVPERVAVVGINNSVYTQIASPQITSIDNKLSQSGVICAEMLSLIFEGKAVPRKTVISTELVRRETA